MGQDCGSVGDLEEKSTARQVKVWEVRSILEHSRDVGRRRYARRVTRLGRPCFVHDACGSVSVDLVVKGLDSKDSRRIKQWVNAAMLAPPPRARDSKKAIGIC